MLGKYWLAKAKGDQEEKMKMMVVGCAALKTLCGKVVGTQSGDKSPGVESKGRGRDGGWQGGGYGEK